MAEEGGYVYDFLESVPDRYICLICTNPLRDPHLVVCCGQHYCESCLDHWKKEQSLRATCPHCRAEFQHVVDKKLRREIESLLVKCTNHKEGCEWTGELRAMKGHLESTDGCGYVEVKCSKKCLELLTINPNRKRIRRVKRNDLARHLKEECSNRQYQCIYCNKIDTYEDITGDCYNYKLINYHHNICKEFPIECPNKCGAEHIKRKDMDNHISICPLERVQCPNRCVQPRSSKTVINIKRKDLDKHLKEDCYLRPYQCQYCNLNATYHEITGNGIPNKTHRHYQECPGFPLDCPNNCGKGKVKRGEMQTHRQQCPEEDVPCPNKCTVETGKVRALKRKNLHKHTTEECMLREYQCEHCQKKYTYKAITRHYSTCPQYPLECPNKCGSKIMRNNLTQHRTVCPQEPVECLYADAGCTVKLVRQDLELHNSTMVEQHLNMVMKAFDDSRQQHEKTTKNLQQTTKELQQTKHELTEVKRKLKETEMLKKGLQHELSESNKALRATKQEVEQLKSELALSEYKRAADFSNIS